MEIKKYISSPCSDEATRYLNYLRKGVVDLKKLTDPEYAEARAIGNPAHASNILNILENQDKLKQFRKDLAEIEKARLEAGCSDDNQDLPQNDILPRNEF